MSTWQLDTETGEHFFPIDDDAAMKVYKTAVGDYAITCHSEAAGHGGDCEYEPDLRKAKKLAERMASDGSWVDLA